MRCLIIHNPDAGDGEPIVKEVKQGLQTSHYEVNTVGHDEGKKLARALEERPDIVAVLGGDGTMGALLEHLPLLQMPILILPNGTANNIATSLGIQRSPLEIVAALPRINTRRLDIGAVVGPFGARNFFEAVGFGVFATTMDLGIDAETAEKRLEKARHAVAAAVAAHVPKVTSIAVDGERLEGEFLFVEVTSIGRVGPGLVFVEDAAADDGSLDVIALRPEQRAQMVDWLLDQSGSAPVEIRRGHRVEVESEDRFRIDDKEVPINSAVAAVDITTGRAGLRIMIPSENSG
jgi:diacylglycerol kinase family enzyme